jgi:NAD(P)-dependent dehydrogenase (short-subunit alcohol dehydrogenase family)
MSNRILITGASGLIATTLAKRLTELGFECVFLSANKRRKGEQNYFYWNISTGELDERCLDGVDSIVHLAGAGIADKAWTPAYKKEIVDSRSGATALLLEKVKQRGGRLRSFVSASGIGFYPSVDEALDEKAAHGSDFVANVCLQWETAANAVEAIGRTTGEKIGPQAERLVQQMMGLAIKLAKVGRQVGLADLGFAARVGRLFGDVLEPWNKAITLSNDLRMWRELPDLQRPDLVRLHHLP